MPNYNHLEHIQIEITTHCNARCPGCGRNHEGGETVEYLNIHHMNTTVWQKLIADSMFQSNVKQLQFNGMFGDPMMHPKIADMLSQLPRTISLEFNTNGSMRTVEFWKEFGQLLSEFEHTVNFGIDGLEDTHAIHRRGTKWHKVIENCQTFNQNGGNSQWVMIVFDHNRHQIDQCKSLSKKIGCESFILRHSYQQELIAKNYHNDQAMTLTAPSEQEVEKIHLSMSAIKHEEWDETPKSSLCEWHNDNSIQISADGRVWPCCVTCEEYYLKENKDSVWSKININNSLTQHSLTEILTNDFFSNQIDQIWQNNQSEICVNCIKYNFVDE